MRPLPDSILTAVKPDPKFVVIGRGPPKLSPAGSLDAISSASATIKTDLDTGFHKRTQGSNDVVFKTLSKLHRPGTKLHRPGTKLDKRAIEYCDAILDIGQWIKLHRNDKIISRGDVDELQSLVNRLDQKENKIKDHAPFME